MATVRSATAAEMSERRRGGDAAGAGATAGAADSVLPLESATRASPESATRASPMSRRRCFGSLSRQRARSDRTAAGVSAGRAFQSGGSRSTAVSVSVTSSDANVLRPESIS